MRMPLPSRLLLLRQIAAVAAFIVSATAWPAPTPTSADDPPVGWWRDATFYEIFVRSFADSTSGPLANDGIGDLQGLIDHLDYLNDGRGASGHSLGVNALWLMPIQPSPSYHGYDVSDYFAVNPQFGDLALIKRFVAEAHRHGIRVIIDLVLNHASSQHPLFQQAISRDPAKAAAARPYFRFAELPEQLTGPWGNRVWHPINDEFYYGIFSSDMPDWNFRYPGVTEHHRKVADSWLREVGVDGFRLDAVRYFYESGEELQDTEETRQWLRDFTSYCHAVKPGAFVIGEDTAEVREIAQVIRGGSLDSGFEFNLAHATIEAVRLKTPGILTQELRWLREQYGNDSPWAVFLTNHDQERTLTQLDGNVGETRLATELMFTLPGVPFLYYGEELGMRGAKPDPELRTPMPWTAAAPNAGFTAPNVKPWHALTNDVAHVNVAVEDADPHSMLALYRRLIRLNASSPALRHGVSLAVAANERKVYACMRETDDEVVLVLANFADAPQSGAQLTLEHSRLRSGWPMHEELAGAAPTAPVITAAGGFRDWTPLAQLAPKTAYVIRWRAP